jgi:hypothetical protein
MAPGVPVTAEEASTTATVVGVQYLGAFVRVRARVDDNTILIVDVASGSYGSDLSIGASCTLAWRRDLVRTVDDTSQDQGGTE